MLVARRLVALQSKFIPALASSSTTRISYGLLRHYATDDVIPAPKGSAAKSQNPKLTQIADNIASLTLLETSELVGILKAKLNIGDIPIMAPSGGAPAGAAAVPKADAKAEEAPAKKEQAEFVVKLEKFDETKKAQAIRAIKDLTGLALVEAKKFVESAPKVVKERVPKEEAEKMKKKLEEAGVTVLLE